MVNSPLIRPGKRSFGGGPSIPIKKYEGWYTLDRDIPQQLDAIARSLRHPNDEDF